MGRTPTPIITEICEVCECPFERGPGRRQFVCGVCRTEAMVEKLTAFHNKSGEHWENYVRSQLLYYRSEAKRLGVRV